MEVKAVKRNGKTCALVCGDGPVVVDGQSMLDVLITASYEANTKDIIVPKELVSEDFFVLSTGLAGEILQKLVNYEGRIAIYGDYSRYTSKPLKDFIYESNRGRDAFFVATLEEALDALTKA